MRKNRKKVLSLILALAMVLSMNAAAFASEDIRTVSEDITAVEAPAETVEPVVEEASPAEEAPAAEETAGAEAEPVEEAAAIEDAEPVAESAVPETDELDAAAKAVEVHMPESDVIVEGIVSKNEIAYLAPDPHPNGGSLRGTGMKEGELPVYEIVKGDGKLTFSEMGVSLWNADKSQRFDTADLAVADPEKPVYYITGPGVTNKPLSSGSEGISFNAVGEVTIKVSYNNAGLSGNYCDSYEVKDDQSMPLQAKIYVVDPKKCSVSAVVNGYGSAKLPYGYTEKLANRFTPADYMKVVNNGRDITRSSTVTYKMQVNGKTVSDGNTMSGNQYATEAVRAMLHKAEVGDKLGIWVMYNDDEGTITASFNEVEVVKQAIQIVPTEKIYVTYDAKPEDLPDKAEGDVQIWYIDPQYKEAFFSGMIGKMEDWTASAKASIHPGSMRYIRNAGKMNRFESDMHPALTDMADSVKPSISGNFTIGQLETGSITWENDKSCTQIVQGWVSYSIEGATEWKIYFTQSGNTTYNGAGGNRVRNDSSIKAGENLKCASISTEAICGSGITRIPNWDNPDRWQWKLVLTLDDGRQYTDDAVSAKDLISGYDGIAPTVNFDISDLVNALHTGKDTEYVEGSKIKKVEIWLIDNSPKNQKYDKEKTELKFQMAPLQSVPYTGRPHVMTGTATDGRQTDDLKVAIRASVGNSVRWLTNGVDYDLSYRNNTNVAKADDVKAPMVIVKGLGEFAGLYYESYFQIRPADLQESYDTGSLIANCDGVSYTADKNGNITVNPTLTWISDDGKFRKNVSTKDYEVTIQTVANCSIATNGSKVNVTFKNGGQAARLKAVFTPEGSVFDKNSSLEVEFQAIPSASVKLDAKNRKKAGIIEYSASKTSVTARDFVKTMDITAGTGKNKVTVSETDLGIVFDAYLGTGTGKKWQPVPDENGDPIKNDGAVTNTGTYYVMIVPTENAKIGAAEGFTGCVEDKAVYVKVTFKGSVFPKQKFGIDVKKVDPDAADPKKNHEIRLTVPALEFDGANVRLYHCSSKTGFTEFTVGKENAGKEIVINGEASSAKQKIENYMPGKYTIEITGLGGYSKENRQVLTYTVNPYSNEAIHVFVVDKTDQKEPAVIKDKKIPFNAGGYIKSDRTDIFGRVAIMIGPGDKPDAELTAMVQQAMKVSVKGSGAGAAVITLSNLKNGTNTIVKGSVRNTEYAITEADLTAKETGDEGAIRLITVVGELNEGKPITRSVVEKNMVLYQKSAAKGVDAEGNYRLVRLKAKTHYNIREFRAVKGSGTGSSVNRIVFTGSGTGKSFFNSTKDLTFDSFPVAANPYTAGRFTIKTTQKSYRYTGQGIVPVLELQSKTDNRTVYLLPGGDGMSFMADSADAQYDEETEKTLVKKLGYRVSASYADNFYPGNKATVHVRFIPVETDFKYNGSTTVRFRITK